MPTRLEEFLQRRVVLLVLWASSVAVVAVLVGHYWIPLDDGTLAQSAERVLGGELPHRDFADPYSGLNAVLGALAFRVFGVTLAALRIPLVVGFALWVPAVYLLARRLAPMGVALGATLLAATLSVPAYPAAMPTWFGLFIVTWGLWCFVRYLDTDGRQWLVLAGVAGGLAVLFKIVGLYFVAAVLLTVAGRRGGGRSHGVVVGVGVLVFLAMVARLVLPARGASAAFYLYFFAPAAAMGLVAVLRAARGSGARKALEPMIAEVAVFVVGISLPVVLFLIPYVASGSAGAWAAGVFLAPTGRLGSSASGTLGGLETALPGLLAIGALAWAGRLSPVGRRRLAVGLAALLAATLALDELLDGGVMGALWYSARSWIPWLTLWGAWVLGARRDAEPDPAALAVLATAALWSLVQFPYPAPAYFFYAAPLGVLATLAVLRAAGQSSGPVLALMAALYLFLGSGYAAGVMASGTTPLELERGGIRVSATDGALYSQLVSVVEEHVGQGGIYVTPDAPEVYFLTGRPNPTPTFYEVLDPEPPSVAEVEAMLAEVQVSVVVVNTQPIFSPTVPPDVLEILLRRYPESRTVGHFIVRWRSEG